jgi:hypothetical protein
MKCWPLKSEEANEMGSVRGFLFHPTTFPWHHPLPVPARRRRARPGRQPPGRTPDSSAHEGPPLPPAYSADWLIGGPILHPGSHSLSPVCPPGILGPMKFSHDHWAMLNSIPAAGLHPELMIRRDYLLILGYPPGAGFGVHWDSRYRWGKEVVGVSIGATTNMYFAYNRPDNRYTCELPRALTREELNYGVRWVKRWVQPKFTRGRMQMTLQVPLHSGSVYIMVSIPFPFLNNFLHMIL